MPDNWPGLVKKDDPDWNDPQFQHRIVKLVRPFPIVSNVHEVTLDCGHKPLLLGDNPQPKIGLMCFCGDCRDIAKGITPP